MTHAHDWKPTNRYAVHAQVGKQRQVWFVRCACGENGYIRGGSAVVYTWTKDETQWEVA